MTFNEREKRWNCSSTGAVVGHVSHDGRRARKIETEREKERENRNKDRNNTRIRITAMMMIGAAMAMRQGCRISERGETARSIRAVAGELLQRRYESSIQ